MRRFSLVSTALVVVLVLAAAVAGPVAAQSDAAGDDERRCFPPGGHELGIGNEGPGIALTVHTSLFTNLTDAGALGIEARGSALNTTIIELRTGVVFDGVGPLRAFLSNPFARFAILFDYSFELPMFAGLLDGSSYESDESPVSGVESRSC